MAHEIINPLDEMTTNKCITINSAIDVFSIGVLQYKMVLHEFSPYTKHRLKRNQKQDKKRIYEIDFDSYEKFAPKMSKEVFDFLSFLLKANPEDRLKHIELNKLITNYFCQQRSLKISKIMTKHKRSKSVQCLNQQNKIFLKELKKYLEGEARQGSGTPHQEYFKEDQLNMSSDSLDNPGLFDNRQVQFEVIDKKGFLENCDITFSDFEVNDVSFKMNKLNNEKTNNNNIKISPNFGKCIDEIEVNKDENLSKISQQQVKKSYESKNIYECDYEENTQNNVNFNMVNNAN